MARFKLTVEYVGTRYSGWQIQKNARTVAGEITAAVRRVSERTDFELYGAGRTDAGVHALGQVAHLDLNTRLRAAELRLALNDHLPADIHVLAADGVPRRFHARHDARARSYLYQVSRRRTAFGKPLVWWIKDRLDARAMGDGLARLLGVHDFRAFAADDPEEKSTKVAIERALIRIRAEGDLLLIRVVGSHFLWKMMRRLVGVLAEVGRGALAVADVDRLLRRPTALPAALTAPPSGLFLERVFYGDESRDFPLHSVVAVGTPGAAA
jgi:tRNA pseudouridine38-40 synthase